MKLLEDAIRDGAFLLDVDASDMPSIIQQTISHLVAQDLLPAEQQDDVVAALLEREGGDVDGNRPFGSRSTCLSR